MYFTALVLTVLELCHCHSSCHHVLLCVIMSSALLEIAVSHTCQIYHDDTCQVCQVSLLEKHEDVFSFATVTDLAANIYSPVSSSFTFSQTAALLIASFPHQSKMMLLMGMFTLRYRRGG